MILYLDTSAFIKLYVDEPGAADVRRAVARAAMVHTHWITYPEMRAALARLQRLGQQSADDHRRHKKEFERDWRAVYAITPREITFRRAGALAEQFGLRGYDSVHLAAAESLWSHVPETTEFRFAAFDAPLATAARALGMLGLTDE